MKHVHIIAITQQVNQDLPDAYIFGPVCPLASHALHMSGSPLLIASYLKIYTATYVYPKVCIIVYIIST